MLNMRLFRSCRVFALFICAALFFSTPGWADILSGTFSPAVHDPSRMVYDSAGNRWLIFYTGNGIPYAISTDQVNWTHVTTNRVFPNSGTGSDNTNYWAPDMWPTPIHGNYYLFYSLSSFGSQVSSIKVLSTPSLSNTTTTWTKLGNAIASTTGDPYNTIDPCPFYDPVQDRLWLTFGSFWKGIYIVELDPSDPTHQVSTPIFLAGGRPGPNAIEGSFVFQHDGYFYLNASVDTCCQGSASTYKQIIGRSTGIMGPYLDRDGVDLRTYGGTIFTAGADSEIGPGQFGLYSFNGVDRFTYHLYSNTAGGASVLGGRAIEWDDSGWPLAVFPATIPQGIYMIRRQGTDLYLHVRNESADPTAEGHVEQDVLGSRPSQNWLFFPQTSPGGGTYYNIQNLGTGLWLTIANNPGDNRAVVSGTGTDFVREDYPHDLATNDSQKWRVVLNADGSYGLQSYRSGLTVGLPTTSTAPLVAVNQKPWVFSNQTLMRFNLNYVADLYANSLITVARGGFVYNFATGRFNQTITLTNTTQAAIPGPISLVLDSLSSNASLYNVSGVTAVQAPLGSPYANSAGLGAGQSINLILQFTDPAKTAITYDLRVMAGSAPR
jgi:arabinan endo-1,5-alpha-L-arabinosidase